MAVTGLDHIVLVVADVERSLAWYIDELGLAPERVNEWRAGEVFFPSVRVDASTIIDIVPGEVGPGRGNVDHFCLVVDDDIKALADSKRFNVVEGPVQRWGARGEAISLYVRDPDGNQVELRRYPS